MSWAGDGDVMSKDLGAELARKLNVSEKSAGGILNRYFRAEAKRRTKLRGAALFLCFDQASVITGQAITSTAGRIF